MVISEECTQGEAKEEEQTIIDSITLEDLLTEKMELSRWVVRNRNEWLVHCQLMN